MAEDPLAQWAADQLGENKLAQWAPTQIEPQTLQETALALWQDTNTLLGIVLASKEGVPTLQILTWFGGPRGGCVRGASACVGGPWVWVSSVFGGRVLGFWMGAGYWA